MFKKLLCITFCFCMIVCGSAIGAKEKPRYGGTLVFGRGGDSVGLDPAFETDGNSFMVCDNVYDQLVTYAEESTDIIPDSSVSFFL